MIIEMLALALLAQSDDQWEQATDRAISAGGIRNIATDIYVTCMPQSGIVHITIPGQPAYRLQVASGALRAKILQLDLAEDRSHMTIDAADPALEAAVTGPLKVGRHELGFSERDRASYKLLVTRICRKPAE
jgi:hypothetical protein